MLPRHHRVALVDRGSDRVLVESGELPGVAERWPSVRDLTVAVGDQAAWPVAAPWRLDDGTVINVLLAGHTGAGDGRDWRPVADVDLRLASAVRELRTGVPADGRADWWRPGWTGHVNAWVDAVLAAVGAVRLGRGEPVKIWSLSAVVRYAVTWADGRVTDIWFKATCEGFRAEAAITAWLTDVVPDLVPVLVAHDPARAWMLLEPFEGADDEPSIDELAAVARAVAEAQVAVRDQLDGLLAAGAPDRGAAATIAGLREVVRDGVERGSMTDEQRRAVAAAEPSWVEQVIELHGLGLPVALAHGDLHLWNIGRSGTGRPVVFDWTDACLAHPYLDARHLARSAAHALGEAAGDVVRDAFVGVWRAAYPDVDHERAWELSLVGDRVFTLLSYEGIYRAQRPEDRWELAGVSVEILNELAGLAART